MSCRHYRDARGGSDDDISREDAATPVMLLLMISLVRGGVVRAASAPDDVARLIQQLHDPDVQHRRDAARDLSKISPLPPDALGTLVNLLDRQDTDPEVQGFANNAVCNAGVAAIPIATQFAESTVQFTSYIGIGLLGCLAANNEAARPVLIKMYAQNPSNVPSTAAWVGAPMLPLLFDALHGSDPPMREAALMTLGQMAYDGRVTGKENLVKNHSGYVAPADLTAIKPDLAAALGDGNLKLRGAAAVALNYVDSADPRVVPVFIDLAKEKNAPFRDYAIKALGDFGSTANAAIVPLEGILATSNEILLQTDAGEALAKIEGRAACAALEKAVARKHGLDDAPLSRVIAQIDPPCPSIIAVLIATLDQEYPPDSDTNQTLARMGAVAVPQLAEALKSHNIYMRENAADALAAMRPLPPEAVKVLVAALKDKNSEVRSSAISALRDVGGEAQKAAEAADRQRDVQAAQASRPDTRLYTMKQIVAPIPPDDEYMYPLETVYTEALTKSGTADAKFIAAVQAGQDRSDRLVFWKKVGDDRYQQAKVMYSEEEYVGMGDHFDKPFSFESPYEEHRKGAVTTKTGFFVDAPIRGWRSYTDNIFAIDDDQLVPVEFKGEGIDIENGKLTFASSIYKEHDPTCCPTGGIESGTYKDHREC